MAALLYRLVLSTRNFGFINWYSRMQAKLGYTATYQMERGWIIYRIPKG